MKNFIIYTILLILFSCNSDTCCDNIDISIGFSVKDTLNNDLLNPDISNRYSTDSIEIIYLIDGEKINAQEYFSSQNYILDHPKGYSFYENEDENEYCIWVFPNYVSENDNLYTTFIKWNASDTDTIKCEFEDLSTTFRCTKVIFNGKAVWQVSSGTERFIEIIK